MNSMVSIILTLLAILVVVRFILKKYNPVLVFSIAGVALLFVVTALTGSSLMEKATTGSLFLDVFAYIGSATKNQLRGVGSNLMIVASYAMYMNHIKASDKLAFAMTKPLGRLGNPYLILASVYVVGIVMKMMITSHVGLSLLLMATTFPILLRLGVSRLSAASTVFLSGGMDWGVNDGACIFAAETVTGLSVADYFTKYQLLPALANIAVVAFLIMFYFRYLDRKAGVQAGSGFADAKEDQEVEALPGFYAIFPALPLLFVLSFSMFTDMKMDVFTANVIGISIVLVAETFRLRSFVAISDQLATVFKGMGNAFANILSLIIMAGIFAQGLIKLGGVNILFDALSNMGNAQFITIIALSVLSFVGVMVLGTGNATWFAFGPLIPNISKQLGLETVAMAVPVQLSASIGRGLSPVSGALLAVTGAADIDMQDLLRRNMIPVIAGQIAMLAVSYVTLVL